MLMYRVVHKCMYCVVDMTVVLNTIVVFVYGVVDKCICGVVDMTVILCSVNV